MFELFGGTPLFLILLLVLVLSFFSIFIGKFFAKERIQNSAIDLIIGLFFLLGIVAVTATLGRTIFLPLIVSIPLIFKPNLNNIRSRIIESFIDSIKFSSIFIIFFLIEIYRQKYFSSEFVNSSWADYSFYLVTIRNILSSGTEGSLVSLFDYSINVGPNIYHYFDLYLLSPIFALKIPPLLGYLFYYLPFVYSLSAYCLIHLFDTKFNFFKVLISVLVIHNLGINFSELISENRFSIIYNHKAAFFIIPIILFQINRILSKSDMYVLVLLISLTISPILFLICFLPFTIYLFTPLNRIKDEIIAIFNKRNIIILTLLIAYLFNIFSTVSDNSSLFIGEGSNIEISVFYQFLFQVKNTFSTFKLLPHLFVFLLFLILQILKNRSKISTEVYLSFGVLFSGIIFSLVFFKHYDGTQFFVIPLTGLLALLFYMSISQVYIKSIIYGRTLGFISIGLYLLGFILSGYSIYTTPRALNEVSIEFNKEIAEYVNSGKTINSILFPSLKYETDWLLAIPYFPFDVGYLNFFNDSKCTLPFSVDFFLENENYKTNALNFVSKGPFQQHCSELKLKPKSYYDKDFEVAITSFIKNHSINTIIFDKSLELPKWIDKMDIVKSIVPKSKYDKHKLFFLQ